MGVDTARDTLRDKPCHKGIISNPEGTRHYFTSVMACCYVPKGVLGVLRGSIQLLAAKGKRIELVNFIGRKFCNWLASWVLTCGTERVCGSVLMG